MRSPVRLFSALLPGSFLALAAMLAACVGVVLIAPDNLVGAAVCAGVAVLGAWAWRRASRGLADAQASFRAFGRTIPGVICGATRGADGALYITIFSAPPRRSLPAGTKFDMMLRLIHPDDRQAMREAFSAAEDAIGVRGAGPTVTLVRAHMPADPTDWTPYEDAPGQAVRWLRVAVRGRHGRSGAPVVEGVALDVTDLMEAREVAERAALLEADNRQMAEERARSSQLLAVQKSEILSMMAHEIRTPLTGVIGFADLLCAATNLPEEARRHAEIVHSTGSVLLSVVNDILDLAKLEAGKVSIEHLPFRPDDVLRQALALTEATGAERGLTLKLELSAELPDWIAGDPLRLRQIVGNLLSNAVKFTERGSVTLRVSVVSIVPQTQRLRIEIEDTGIGIEAEAIDRLFLMFEQADVGTTRRFGGTGLGLALCKRLVEAMDGQIGVRSTPAVGSVFWLELPLVRSAPAPSQDPVTAEHSIERQLHVLVVDDIATNRELLRTMLSRMGDVAVLAVNGVEAIAAVQRAPFDVVLMDVNMPDMDGLEATRHIRALEGRAGRIPILALTAGATDADKARTRDAGMNAHITKPVGRAKLAEALAPLRG